MLRSTSLPADVDSSVFLVDRSLIVIRCRVFLVMVGVLASCSACAYGRNEEARDRLNQMLSELGAPPVKYSVLLGTVIMQKPDVTGPRIVLVDEIARRIVNTPARTNRLDLFQVQTEDTTIKRWSHWLIDGKIRYRGGSTFSRDRFNVMQLAENAPMPGVDWLDPELYKLSISNYFSTRPPSVFDFVPVLAKHQAVAGKYVDDQFVGLYIDNNIASGVIITYMKDPKWIPVRIQFFETTGRQILREEKIFEKVPDWRKFADTRSAWQQLESKRWVPVWVSMKHSNDPNGESAEVELFLADWKFDDDVDEKLLDRDEFTKEKLMAIDFDEMKSKIKEVVKSQEALLTE